LRDLSLHILDLIENSIRAGASIITVFIKIKESEDLLEIVVEDNGHGLSVPSDKATDPFYTTKLGKRTGLGLSMFREAVERAGGTLILGRSSLGGLMVRGKMKLNHIDRSPLGDIAGTLSSIVCTNSNLDLRFNIETNGMEHTVKVSDFLNSNEIENNYGLTVARQVNKRLKELLSALKIMD